MTTILFTSGLLIDGSGAPGVRSDLLVEDGFIKEIGPDLDTPAEVVIDIKGSVIAPGFIDVHTHSDLTLLSNPLAQSKIRQGVTTEVIGNCGFSVAPIPIGIDKEALKAAVAYLELDPSIKWDWNSFGDYLDTLDKKKISLNTAALVGHIPLHTAVVGFGKDEATPEQIIEMKELLRQSMREGAFGISTGLMYSPLSYASRAELIGFGEVVAEFDGIFAWHMRDYGNDLMEAIAEVIDVAKTSGARTQISHLVAVGERNWGKVTQVMAEIDKANGAGCEISIDVYPYTAGNCPLSQFLPPWAQEGGETAMCARMEDGVARQQILTEWNDPLLSWDQVTVSSVPNGRESLVGKSISTIAAEMNLDGDNAVMDLLGQMGNTISIIAGGRSEDDVAAVFNHGFALVGSDGQALDPHGPTGSGSPHPRSYGCFPRLLNQYVGRNGLTIERAIHISTGAVAKKMHIKDRGLLKTGMRADLVVFDPLLVKDMATFEKPHQYPVGISHVMVNGVLAIKDSEHTGARSGAVLKLKSN